MPDDILFNKLATMERCLSRVREEYRGGENELESDQTRQDTIVLNLQRARETSIDLAMHLVRRRRLGLRQESRQAFALLEEAGLMGAMLSGRMTSHYRLSQRGDAQLLDIEPGYCVSHSRVSS